MCCPLSSKQPLRNISKILAYVEVSFDFTVIALLVCAQMLILIVKSYDQGSVLIVNSRIQCVSSAQMLKLTLQDHSRIRSVPSRRADVDIDHEFSLHSGVLSSGVLTIRGLTIRGSYNQGFYNQEFLQSGSYNLGFLQSGVLTISGSYNQGFTSMYLTWPICAQLLILIIVPYIQGFKWTCLTWQVCWVFTIRGSYDQGFLQSGVQMNVYYMTSLCSDVDIDRKILRSRVRVDRKLLHLVRIVCSDVDIDLTLSHPCRTRVLMFISIVISYIYGSACRCRYRSWMLSLHPGVLDSYLTARGFLIVPLNSRYVTMAKGVFC